MNRERWIGWDKTANGMAVYDIRDRFLTGAIADPSVDGQRWRLDGA